MLFLIRSILMNKRDIAMLIALMYVVKRGMRYERHIVTPLCPNSAVLIYIKSSKVIISYRSIYVKATFTVNPPKKYHTSC